MTGNPHLTRRWPFGRVTEGLPTTRPELTDHCEPWLSRSHVIARAPSGDLILWPAQPQQRVFEERAHLRSAHHLVAVAHV